MYILEGTIGAGKSTFLKLLAQQLPYITIKLEPLDNWQSQQHGQSLLANFYQNPIRWAYTLETFTLFCRIREHMHEQETVMPTIVERSIYSGHSVFARNSYESGFMTELEWDIYNQLFSFLAKNSQIPQGFIYLKVNPEIAFERIKKRNRSAEKTLSFDYLNQINKHHENFLINKSEILPQLKNVPVLVLDCNDDFENDPSKFQQQCKQIQDFFEQTEGVFKSSNL